MDKSDSTRDYTHAIMLFTTGAVAAVMSACFGYFSQLYYSNHLLGSSKAYRLHCIWQIVTIVFVAISLIFAVLGLLAAAQIARG